MEQAFDNFIDDEIEWSHLKIIAAESWGENFKKDPTTHEAIMKAEGRLFRQVRKAFRDTAKSVDKYVNWYAYAGYVNADIQVDVIVSDKIYDDLDNTFIKVTFDTLLLATLIGAQAGEAIYNIPLGIDSTDTAMMNLTTDRLASLVGKKLDPETGEIVDNPNSTYSISDQTRKDIATSVKTSIGLGEDRDAATKRLMNTIDSPKRALMIAQTESVNAYSQGLLEFGRQSNATGKEWQSTGATDICAEYEALGVVDFGYYYDEATQLSGPAAHPNCRCGLRLTYEHEYPKK